jgi:hypothetical protein
VFIECVEVGDLNGKDVFAISDLKFKSFVIDPCVLPAEVVKEVLEDMFVMGISALDKVIRGAKVLVGEVNSFAVHSRKYSIIELKMKAQKNDLLLLDKRY